MDDNKKQESKKTVVAFVAGLLIGGLLVWTFAASPENSELDKVSDDNKTDTALEKKVDATPIGKTDSTKTTKEPVQGNFTFTVLDQLKGMTVLLGDNVQYPTKEGWIAVQDDMNGKLGNVLGASRYNTEVGLTPDSVELLRSMEAGKTYHVVYYTESGDRIFNRKDDVPLTATGGGIVETTFVAK